MVRINTVEHAAAIELVEARPRLDERWDLFTMVVPGRWGGAAYPLGTNVAVYLGPASFMVELETMSPIVKLAPGAWLRHVERWTFRPPA